MWVGWCIIIAMRSIPASVESSVLRWARESCGLTEVAAARKLGLPDDRVAAWEVGEVVPTIAQLRKAAEVYKRSLAVFFLSEPPEGFDTLRDFRRLDGAASGQWTPGLHEEFRRAHTQRDFALELADAEDREDTGRLAFAPIRRRGRRGYRGTNPQGLDRGQPVAYPRGLG